MRTRDAGHEFHRQRFKPGLCISFDAILMTERIKRGGHPCARRSARQRQHIGRLHAQHDIGLGHGFGERRNCGPRSNIVLVRD